MCGFLVWEGSIATLERVRKREKDKFVVWKLRELLFLSVRVPGIWSGHEVCDPHELETSGSETIQRPTRPMVIGASEKMELPGRKGEEMIEPVLASTLISHEELDTIVDEAASELLGERKRRDLKHRLTLGVKSVDEVLGGGIEEGVLMGISGEGVDVSLIDQLPHPHMVTMELFI